MKFRLVICLAVLATGLGSQAQEPVHIQLDGKVRDWVMDETTGRVFASVAMEGEGAVLEFDPATGKELRRFAVGVDPFSLFILNFFG